MTGVETFQCLRASRNNRQTSNKAEGITVNCTTRCFSKHTVCFASTHKCSNQSLLQGFRGQNCGGTVQRRCGTHHPGHPWRAALHLHLRGSCQTQGTEQENNIHPGHPAAQPGLLIAQDGGTGERWEEKSRKGCWSVLISPPHCVSGKLLSL